MENSKMAAEDYSLNSISQLCEARAAAAGLRSLGSSGRQLTCAACRSATRLGLSCAVALWGNETASS